MPRLIGHTRRRYKKRQSTKLTTTTTMATHLPNTGAAFVGPSNLHNDIYPSISAVSTPALHQPGKVILITGAGRGIGRAMALQYAHAHAASIILCARTLGQLSDVAASIRGINPDVRVHTHAVDVSSAEAVDALASAVRAQESRLDVLVNNAGHSAAWVPVEASDPADWWRTMEVNLKGPYLMARAFLPMLVDTAEKQGTAHVVNLASVAAHLVTDVASAYQVSKLALCRLTQHLDAGYAGKGVNVVAVNPGGVQTALSEQELEILGPCELS